MYLYVLIDTILHFKLPLSLLPLSVRLSVRLFGVSFSTIQPSLPPSFLLDIDD